jgi:hypothetical protein
LATADLDNRLTDGGEVVSLNASRPSATQEDFWYSFLLEAELTQGHNAAGRIRSIEQSNPSGQVLKFYDTVTAP